MTHHRWAEAQTGDAVGVDSDCGASLCADENRATLPGSIGVLVVDDHPIFRAGVVAIISQLRDIHVVAEAGDGYEAVRLYRLHRPHIVLMDLRMPEMGGVDAIAIITAEFPQARVLVLSTYDGDIEAIRAVKAGALGYLLKTSVLHQLPLAIRKVSHGISCLPSEIAEGIREYATGRPLTLREIEVLRLVAAGNTNKWTAKQLGITGETVKTHMNSILAKLGARDRTHAVSIGIRRGIIVG